ncbi:hypothetical protein FACS1894169_15230 [Bacteroidia bacterium]|nr:hypothetical protein FACS1894169_15230 [Bacteroidia bacterium]
MSLYTGIPDISVPLYEIKLENISVPISANYHLASVKPNVTIGSLGLGWTLISGGCITRTVRGVYDEKCYANGSAPGYYANSSKMKGITPEKFEIYTNSIQTSIDSPFFELTADEFSFNFCGYSGNFYYNEDGGWTVVSEQDIKVIFNPQDGFINLSQLGQQRPSFNFNLWNQKNENNRFFNKFTLVTPDGCKYTFGGNNATEYSISYYNRDCSDLIPTTWYLTKIVAPNGREVNYTYNISDPICDIRYSPQQTILYNLPYANSNNPNKITTGRAALTGFLLFPVTLKQIVTPNEIIDFHFTEDLWHINKYSDVYLAWKTVNAYDRGSLFYYFSIAGHLFPSDFQLFII